MSTCRNCGRRCAGWAVASFALVACLVPAGAGAALPDHRGWELVSPTEKNGGSIRAAGEVSGGGVFQAAADGESVTYSSTASFGQPGPERSSWEPVHLVPRHRKLEHEKRECAEPVRLLRSRSRRGSLSGVLPRPRPRPASQRPALPSRGRTLPGRQPTARRDRRARRVPELLPAPGRWLRGSDRRIRRLQLQPRPGPLHCPSGRLPRRPRSRDPRNLRRADHRRDRSPAGRRLRPGEAESLRVVGGLRPEPGQLRARVPRSQPKRARSRPTAPGSTSRTRTTAISTCETPVSSSRSTATPPEAEPSRPPAATAGPRTSPRAVTSGTTRPAPTRPPTSPRPAGSSECSMPPPTVPTPTTSPPTASTSGTGAARRKRQPGQTRPTIRPPPGRPGSARMALG